MADDKHMYDDLARRLCAAAISYRMGVRSVDYALKTYVRDAEIAEYWTALAEQVDYELAASIGEKMRPRLKE